MKTTEYARHAYSVLFRDSDGETRVIERISENMAVRGYDKAEPIVLVRGRDGKSLVLDGWHRYRAALNLGIEPAFVEREFESDADMLRFVEGKNSARKQMSKTQIAAGILRVDAMLPKTERRSPRKSLSWPGAQKPLFVSCGGSPIRISTRSRMASSRNRGFGQMQRGESRRRSG